ncbi:MULTISPECIES: alpha/beta fold hydrolase [unclassified Variovorax]|uniref:PHA/PHB synthase family protein n=1 Tax=unclassified Variovorax TaxID=663243 RepID=UPI00076D1D32|nr:MULTISPECIES: alpha/beta fold hydrolase [unclassified Variovorax]KWT94089.1 Polyhydroxyalkanoic acid synthase [Variovorax sp. WDL1]PNG59951.1 Poly-beta-hydroxybutyrate polymerase [Variovorax sp. B4]PNG60257.1 Poly-beta-hydroxybutyrate polymerase [Variovorax sp. B2]VTV13906.1 Poly-beta-hydroxybutyrate polymerase [Variovorax sp. WDL1]
MDDRVEALDRTLHAGLAQLTRGLSPAALLLAWSDWAIHLAAQPARSAQVLLGAPLARGLEATDQAFQALPSHGPPAPDSHEDDRRLADPSWDAWPFNLYRQAFRASGQWLRQLTEGVPGVERHHEQVVAFAARQLHEICSPANWPATHPLVLQRTAATGGLNLLQGARNFAEDLQRSLQRLPPKGAENFLPGRDVAITPGKVVLRNHLMELIQYAPTTATVHPEPVLIMSAWIMKYYILDLSPHNSLIRYLVDNGHTVFAISWRNPDAKDRDLGIGDYLAQGLMASLDAVNAIVPRQRVHAVGYCLGGTLLAIGAAAMARDRDDRLATVTLLAAQTDFTEPGELGLFIDESQLSFMEDLMARQGYLDSSQMAGAFHLLRAIDLIWSPMVQNYLLGERTPMTDLMAWNADGTRMPYRMHADYLRSLFLDNALARGQYRVNGSPVSLGDIEVPIFAVGTRTDHVAPWRSVYKLNLLCDTEISFVLTDGGHNAGILSEPGHAHRHYRVLHRARNAPYVSPDEYTTRAEQVEGSWWPALQAWLAARSGPRRKPPRMGHAQLGYAPVCDAPGTYVMGR